MIALLLALSLLGPELATARSEPLPWIAGVQRAVAELAADPLLEDVTLGVSVRCEGRTVAEASGDVPMYPASGAKLLSTAAALELMGVERRFETAVAGTRSGERLVGAVLVGGGDPGLEPGDLARLADALWQAGVRELVGDLRLDLGHFAASEVAPAFDRKDTDAAYRPEVPALAVGSGALLVTVRPGDKVGEPVKVSVSPLSVGVDIDNSARTVEGKRLDRLVIETRASASGGTRVVVSGELGKAAKAQGVKKRQFGAARLAALAFIQSLRDRGIGFKGKLVVGPSTDSPPIVARIEGRPLSELVALINKPSNNFMAESAFLQLGGPGGPGRRGATWERAQANATGALLALGIDTKQLELVNGSGLYEATRVSADAMTTLLAALDPKAPPRAGVSPEVREAFFGSLAIAGVDGTLARRLKGAAMRGKTGSLDRALSLSGYLDRKECRLAFSTLVNGPLGKKNAKVVARIDRFVRELAR